MSLGRTFKFRWNLLDNSVVLEIIEKDDASGIIYQITLFEILKEWLIKRVF
jgi:hypothetical protein